MLSQKVHITLFTAPDYIVVLCPQKHILKHIKMTCSKHKKRIMTTNIDSIHKTYILFTNPLITTYQYHLLPRCFLDHFAALVCTLLVLDLDDVFPTNRFFKNVYRLWRSWRSINDIKKISMSAHMKLENSTEEADI